MFLCNMSHNLTSGFGFPLTWIMNEAVDPRMSSDSLSLTRKTGWLEASLSLRSAADTGKLKKIVDIFQLYSSCTAQQ